MAGELNFGLIDPNGPAKIFQSYQQAGIDANALALQQQQLQHSQTQNELSRYQLSSAKRTDAQAQTVNDAYAQSVGPDGQIDYNKLKSLLASGGAGSNIPALNKTQFEAQGAQLKFQKDKKEFVDQSKRDLISNPSDENVTAWGQDAVLKGIMSPDEAKAGVAHMLALNPDARKEYLGTQGLDAKTAAKFVESTPVQKTDGQKVWMEEGNPRLATFGKPLQPAIQQLPTPSAQLAATTSVATNAATNSRIAKEGELNRAAREKLATLRASTPGLTPEQNDALYGEQGAVTLGKLDPAKISSRTAKILADAYLLNPNIDMNALSSNAAMMRNVPYMARQQTIEMLPEVLGNVVTAGKKVNYDDAKFAGAVEQFAKGQMNDPDFVNYMAQRNDALLTLAGVMRGNGATDQAHRAEIEASSPTMSPKALDAWMSAQMTALKPRLKNAAKVTRTPAAPTAPPNAAGAKFLGFED